MKNELVDRNVATLVDLPKSIRKEIRALSPDEVRRFLAEAATDRWNALWVLLVTTGLRPGEALGLKWALLVASFGWGCDSQSPRRAEPTTGSSGAPKNVVLIVADDHVHGKDTGAYGNAVIRTPNLDALAAEGVRFPFP